MKNKVALDALATLLAPEHQSDKGVADYLQSLGIKPSTHHQDEPNQIDHAALIPQDTVEGANIPQNPPQSAFSFGFFTLDSRQPIAPQSEQKAGSTTVFNAAHDNSSDYKPKKPELEPLSPLLLRLQEGLKQQKAGQRPAIKPLVKQLAKKQLIVDIPVLPRAISPHQLTIYLDTSPAISGLASDGFTLAKKLAKFLPHCNSTVIVLPQGPQGRWFYLGNKQQHQQPLALPDIDSSCLIITSLTSSSESQWRMLLSGLTARAITPCWLSATHWPVPGRHIVWGKTNNDPDVPSQPLDLLTALLATCRIIPGAMLRQLIQTLGLAAHFETAFWHQPHVSYQPGADNGFITNINNGLNRRLEKLGSKQLETLSGIIEKHLVAIGQSPLHEHRIHLHLASQWQHKALKQSFEFFDSLGNSIGNDSEHSHSVAQYLATTVTQYDGLIEHADNKVKTTLAKSCAYLYRQNRYHAIPAALAQQTQQLLAKQPIDASQIKLHQHGNTLIVQDDANQAPITAPLLASFEHMTASPLLLSSQSAPEARQSMVPQGQHQIHEQTPFLLQTSVEQLLITPRRSTDFYWAKSVAVTASGVVAQTDYVRVSWPADTATAQNSANRGAIIEVMDHAPDWLHQHQPQLDEFGLFITINVIKDVSFKLRYIPPGSFLMGSPEDEVGRDNDETQHPVTLTQGYWLGETTVSQQLWQAVMNNNPSYFNAEKDELLPVEQVSWDDCQVFCTKFNAFAPGLTLSLPTEAQWEYACRVGSQTPFSTGQQLTTAQANFFTGEEDKLNKTVVINRFDQNKWGLYQMHGNVWEWCKDASQDYLPQAEVDPVGGVESEQSERVLRGGSWGYNGRICRSAYRLYHRRDNAYYNIGLRVTQVEPAGERAVLADPIRSGARAGKSKASDVERSIKRGE